MHGFDGGLLTLSSCSAFMSPHNDSSTSAFPHLFLLRDSSVLWSVHFCGEGPLTACAGVYLAVTAIRVVCRLWLLQCASVCACVSVTVFIFVGCPLGENGWDTGGHHAPDGPPVFQGGWTVCTYLLSHVSRDRSACHTALPILTVSHLLIFFLNFVSE